jgi:hypothetical protein
MVFNCASLSPGEKLAFEKSCGPWVVLPKRDQNPGFKRVRSHWFMIILNSYNYTAHA